jgi:hypothetical protein
MRMAPMISAVLVLSLAGAAFAQEWAEYINPEDGFRVNFSGQPKVTETTYKSEYGADLPARVYSVERGQERYSVTVVDYRQGERLLTAKAKACPPYTDERCTGTNNTGPGYWKMDLGGAITYAQFQFLQRNAKLTHLSWGWQDFVEGLLLQLTNNADQSRTFAAIQMHENRLYILEATVPKGYPEPGIFQQSMGFVNKDGSGIRYQTVYSNLFPAPPRTRGGQGGGGDAGGAGNPAGGVR